MKAYSDLHSGVAALNPVGAAGCARYSFSRLSSARQIGVVPRVTSPPDSYPLFGGFLYVRGENMKKVLPYLCISVLIFLLPLLFLYIGFISPAKAENSSPFIRMTVCTALGFMLTALITRYIHPYTGLAGLDSAKLNLGFTIAILLAVFVEFVTFGNSTVAPYMEGLVQKNKDGAGEYFYGYIKYVYMIGQALIAVRTFVHSALLGVLKAIMKHS